MKIIKQGRLPEKKIWKGTCSRCKTIAEAEQGELSKITHDRAGDFGETKCPTCDNRMIFYPKEK